MGRHPDRGEPARGGKDLATHDDVGQGLGIDGQREGLPEANVVERRTGRIEGRDFELVFRYADGFAERLPKLAEEIVKLNPDVILGAIATAAVAAKAAAPSSLPIVCPLLLFAPALELFSVTTGAKRSRPQ